MEISNTQGYLMSMKEAYEKKLQAQLDEISLEIDKLKAKGRKEEADAEVKYSEEIQKLEALQDEANDKLQSIKDASDDAWEDLKIGLDNAWNSLSVAVNSASSRFEKS
jgi:hypothetical protein